MLVGVVGVVVLLRGVGLQVVVWVLMELVELLEPQGLMDLQDLLGL